MLAPSWSRAWASLVGDQGVSWRPLRGGPCLALKGRLGPHNSPGRKASRKGSALLERADGEPLHVAPRLVAGQSRQIGGGVVLYLA
jgi:hypothetical protein